MGRPVECGPGPVGVLLRPVWPLASAHPANRPGVPAALMIANALGHPVGCRGHATRLGRATWNEPSVLAGVVWLERLSEQGRSDSNAQPAVLETAALPIELHPCRA